MVPQFRYYRTRGSPRKTDRFLGLSDRSDKDTPATSVCNLDMNLSTCLCGRLVLQRWGLGNILRIGANTYAKQLLRFEGSLLFLSRIG